MILLFLLFPSFSFCNRPTPQELLAKVINNNNVKIGLALAKVGTGFVTMTGAAVVGAQVYLNHRVQRGGVDKIPLRWQMGLYGSAAFAGLACAMHGVIDLTH